MHLCVPSLRHDLDTAVVQRLPDTQVEVDFQPGLLVVKLVRQADAEQVGPEHCDAALTFFKEHAQGLLLARIGETQRHVHWLSPP